MFLRFSLAKEGDGSGNAGVRGGRPSASNTLNMLGCAPSTVVASLLGISPGFANGEIKRDIATVPPKGCTYQRGLLDRHTFCEVARLVNVVAAESCYVVGHELEGHHGGDRCQEILHVRDPHHQVCVCLDLGV